MTIQPEYVGITYRLMARGLNVRRAKLEVTRPTKRDDNGNIVYTDSAERPTLVTFPADAVVNVALLLQSGAIAEYSAPTPKQVVEERGGE